VSAAREGDELFLEVRDDGPGFPKNLLASAGQPFRTGRESGTGLGLATVNRTATDLGGSLTFENLEPHGTSVVLQLPFRAPEGSTEREAEATHQKI
jgi:two-component system sensor histidine kinase RegB